MSRERRAQGRPRVTRPRGGDTKRRRVEGYLASLSADQLGAATASSIVAALARQGTPIGERYAGRVLEEWRFDHGVPASGGRQR